VVEARAPAIPTDRFHDSAPYFVGAKILTPGHSRSAGFTALSTGNGRHYMLTAYHCIDPNNPVVLFVPWELGRADDAQKVWGVLEARFKRFGLALHPKKTRNFLFQAPRGGGGSGGATFDFLGFTLH
jgi:hypothetical protein